MINWAEHYNNMANDPQYKEDYLKKCAEEDIIEVNNCLNITAEFVNATDVPRLPVVSDRGITQEKWDNFYVPKLISRGAVPKDQLEDGKWYYGNFRNSNFGKWDEENQNFGHWRMKFGWMWDSCDHFQDDRGFSVFVPIREATQEEVNDQEQIGKENLRRI